MSIDTYFCFCCLSTNELNNFSKNIYEHIQNLFLIKINHEDDIFVCESCANSLKEAYLFKTQVFETLHVLQVNCLVQVIKYKDDGFIVTKVDTVCDTEEKFDEEKHNTSIKLLGDTANSNINKNIKLENEEHTNDEPIEKYKNINSTEVKPKSIKLEKQYEVTDDFKCGICSVVLPNLYVYHTHMNEHYPNHICETCGKGFLTEQRLKRHLTSHRRGSFRCGDCAAIFTNFNTYNSHRQRKHGSGSLYACPRCDARFATYPRRARHLAAAHGAVARHACLTCGKCFLTAGNLSSHVRYKHKREARYRCACGAAFFHKQDLTAHAHAAPAPAFTCPHCDKRYPRKKALIVHIRTHTGDKRYGCDVCEKRFIQKCTLLAHLKVHNRGKETIETEQ